MAKKPSTVVAEERSFLSTVMEKIEYGFYRTVLLTVVTPIYRSVLSLIFLGKKKKVPPVENPLLLKSVTTLAEEIRNGKTKSEDVILAYSRRILEVDPYINATVDRCFQSALEEAKAADALVASGRYSEEQLDKDKPLLGVPFTVKNVLTVKGLLSTAGCTLLADHIATEDSPCVTLLRNAGAIVIANTNVPEFCIGFEARNKAHGTTNNPYDFTRTSGGSSGGESALIAAGGSLLGIGNDLGGSLRVPAHFTGIYAHKPTRGIVPNGGCFPNADFVKDMAYTGPMCRYAEDLVISMNVFTRESHTPMNLGIPVDFKKLKIRFLTSLPDCPLVYDIDKEINEGIRKAALYFEDNYGTDTKEIRIPFMAYANGCFYHKALDKVNKVDDLNYKLTGGKGSHVNAKLDLLKFFIGRSTFSEGMILTLLFRDIPLLYKESEVPFFNGLEEKLEEGFNSVLDENTVLFLPTFPTAAPHHYGTIPFIPSVCYTSIFNVIGLPATQCHLGFNEQGLPYGMQVVGRLNNDPLTIACAIELEKAFGGWISP